MSKEQSAAKYDLVAIGNAIVDILSTSDDDFLKINKINKGSMTLIEAEQAEALYSRMGPCTEMSGGSAANTVAAFASMGGRAGYIGKVANDQLGNVFAHDIRASGVSFTTQPLQDGAPTARCLVMITPDAQRTMCTFLGACVWISPADLDEQMIADSAVTYLEGYLFDRNRAKLAFIKAGQVARAAGRKVALSLSDPFCVERHRDEFLDLIKNHVDIVIANEAEIKSLFQTDDFNEAVYHIRQHCEIAALTRGAEGSVIVFGDAEPVKISAEPVEKVIDTTGAGDMYAAGFLYGLTRGLPLEQCGRIASVAAAEAISHIGARPQIDLSALLREKKAV